MSRIQTLGSFAATALLIAIVAPPTSARVSAANRSPATMAGGADFGKLYTTYSFWTGYTLVDMVVCGSTAGSSGCYGSAQLGPFGHAGAVVEGAQRTSRNGVGIRNLYIVDEGAGGGTGVTLNVYRETITVNSPNVTVNVKPVHIVALPLRGGAGANTYMAANDGYLFIGTDQSPFAVQVDKSDLSFARIGGFSPPINVSAITTDDKGYVTVTFGSNGAPSGFYAYGPDGSLVEDGGGADYMVNESNGLSTGVVSTSSMISKPRLKVRYRHLPQGATGN